MYTDCPGCQRQFHIYATQISVAGGLVKCGFCGEQFNALKRLHDKPMPRLKPEPPVTSPRQPLPEPHFIIPAADAQPAAEHVPAPPQTTPGVLPNDPDRGAGASRIAADAIVSRDTKAIKVSGAGYASTAQESIAVAQQTMATITGRSSSNMQRLPVFDFAETSADQPHQKSSRLSRLLWALGILLMLLFATTQIIWFNRDAIMSHYPLTVPWYNRLCATIECTSIRHQDLSSIQLLNRDVREHPRYQNALLVNATMSNQSQTLQPYPVVQLNLYDTDGNLIAFRQFQPQEYLDESVNIPQGMTPNAPVHFVLEVLDAAAGAVSFEFEFH